MLKKGCTSVVSIFACDHDWQDDGKWLNGNLIDMFIFPRVWTFI